MNSVGGRWSLLVPVKRLSLAKTRLALPAAARADLALAMARDTVGAALVADAVAEVVVITDDERAGAALAAIGARVVDDSPNAGLNPALAHGASVASQTLVAALSSDLPALRSADLDAVLRLATAHRRAFVADSAGDGTTLLSATAVADFAPAYGPDSRTAHVESGAVDLSADAAESVRHDVDTLAALREAVVLGVGPHTAQTLRTHVPLVGL
ncbi:MAG TPA: 2-phospho-L-lactate guanylyltransferase [Mycobacteriales bacterium]|nr:2-phospho-L-lactate guanylyltransferase [Mycobacteriales bacterium]